MFGLGACQSCSYREEGVEENGTELMWAQPCWALGRLAQGLPDTKPIGNAARQPLSEAAFLSLHFRDFPQCTLLKHTSPVGIPGLGPGRCIFLVPLSCVCLDGMYAYACVCNQFAHGFCLHLPKLEFQVGYQTHQIFKQVLRI